MACVLCHVSVGCSCDGLMAPRLQIRRLRVQITSGSPMRVELGTFWSNHDEVPFVSSGHGHQITSGVVSVKSWFRILMQPKIKRTERLMYVKSGEAQSSHVSVVGKYGELGTSSNVILIT
ncbi:hypothetical protein TNCV_2997951 [Trichonephila clavipes]|nr:hypothetical protein TNCV_2997951 [Trichonephila clavipes]